MKTLFTFRWLCCGLAGISLGGSVLLAQEGAANDGGGGGSFSLVFLLPGYSNTPQGTTIGLLPVLFLFPLTAREELWVAPFANRTTVSGDAPEFGNYGVSVSAVHHFSQPASGKRPEGFFVRAQAAPGIRTATGDFGMALSVGGGWHEGQQWFFVVGLSFGATNASPNDSGTAGWSESRWKFDFGLGYRLF